MVKIRIFIDVNRIVFIILKKDSHTSCVTVATSRITSPMRGHLGINFDKDAVICDQIETIATNRNSIATRASSEAYLCMPSFFEDFDFINASRFAQFAGII